MAALVGHLARGVALHEAQHLADLDRYADSVRMEASAYLASFTHPDLGPAAFLQACIGASGAHRVAVEQSGISCDAPPVELAAAATQAQRALGYSGAPQIAADLATHLPLREQ